MRGVGGVGGGRRPLGDLRGVRAIHEIIYCSVLVAPLLPVLSAVPALHGQAIEYALITTHP